MGEMADYLINGDDCERCGMPFDEPGDGYPRLCDACAKECLDAEAKQPKKKPKQAIPQKRE